MGIETFPWFQTAGPIPKTWWKTRIKLLHRRTALILCNLLNINALRVLDTGWPDLLVERNGEIFALEIKGPNDRLSFRQKQMHAMLRKAGLRVGVAHVNSVGSILEIDGLEIKE